MLLLHFAIEKQNLVHYAVRRKPHCNTPVLCLNKIGRIEVMKQSIWATCFEVSIEIIHNFYEKYDFKYYSESGIVAYV